jgi:hypothetical protein
MYLTDGTKSQKVNVARVARNHGITPPTQSATWKRAAPNQLVIDEFNAAGSWAVQATAGAISVVAKFGETIDAVLYDIGSTGWVLIKTTLTTPPQLPSAYAVGARVKLTHTADGTNEFATIRQVNKAIANTTIASIIYDTGSAGLCSIVLTDRGVDYTGLVPDAMVYLAGGTTEYVRVLSISEASDGTHAFRCATVNNHAAGESVQGVYSFRVYAVNTYASGAVDTVTGNMFQSTVAVGTGWIQLDTSAAPLNLTNINNRPAQPADYIHISFKVDVPANVSRLRLYFNIGRTFPTFSSIPDALYYEVPASQITSTWTDLFIKVSDLKSTGSSTVPNAQSLASVTGLIIEAVVVTGSVVILVNSWWIGGTYGPDSKGNVPYSVYYRYRDSTTGARSNPSPITSNALDLWRERGIATGISSTDPQVDTIDFFVIGSTLSSPRLYASITNSSAIGNDDSTDASILIGEELAFNVFQPFPVTDLPRSGVCTVAGTSVKYVSGSPFNTSWQAGAQIIINGIPLTIAAVHSTVFLETIENGGSASNVAFTVPEATLGGQPLRSMWGPDPITGVLFACGAAFEAGSVFWTNPDDPDTASDANTDAVTSPSEPLIAGFMYNGRSYCFSSERLFQGYPQTITNPITGAQTLQYVFQEVPSGKGLFGFVAYAVKSAFFAISRTGIWQYGAEGLQSITDEDLYPLFPHDGQAGTAVNGYLPIDFTHPEAMRLCPTDDSLYFFYLDTSGIRRCLTYRYGIKGWWPETYVDVLFNLIYQEEGESLETVLAGASNGRVYVLNSGLDDDGTNFPFSFTTPALDLGDSRAQKLFLDYMLDAELQDVNMPVTCTPKMDNLTIALASAIVTGPALRAQTPVNIVQPQLTLYRNMALSVSGVTIGVPNPIFYEFQPNGLIQPFLAVNFTTQFQSHGFIGYGHLRDSYFVWISTTDITVIIKTELGLTQTLTLPASPSGLAKRYFPLSQLKGLLFQYSAVSEAPFALFTAETIIRGKSWGSEGPFADIRPWQGQTA